ncbi:MAG: ATP-binding cassette domain-containing protein [Hahellaceae bacterium]|nr:ATP-binding cassette domain-containing protein [Hahellaceae bacterium]MCP5169989.1 ATP-binding cassette domain-containing protein [Hahellaceae bacterium]
MKIFLDLGWFFRREWRRYLVAITALAAVALLTMIPPRITGQLVDQIESGQLSSEHLMMQVVIIVVIALLIYVLRVLWRIYLFGSSLTLAKELRSRVYQHLSVMPATFYQRYRTGDLMARCTQDIEAVQMTAGEGVLSMVDGAMTAVVVLGMMMLTVSWKLSLVALIPWPVMGWLMYRYGNQLHEAFGKSQTRFSELNDQVQDTLSGMRLVKAMGAEALLIEGFRQRAANASEANLAVARIDAAYDPTITVAMGLSFLLSVAFGGYLILQQQLTLGQLTSFMMYLGYLLWPMFAFGWMLSIVERGSASYRRIAALLAEPLPEAMSENTLSGVADIPGKSASIEVDLNEFVYQPTATPILRALHFAVPAGTTLGIIGPVGSGKSTLLQLLLRVYESEPGAIRLNGVPVSGMPLEQLRSYFAWVGQQPFLFSATVAENIALGLPQASPEEIEQVARLAAVHDDIMRFPDGYQTLVGEKGVTLSGGQKQRLAIARALLLKAPILLLDDALSAVDVETEVAILRHLRAARLQATTIIVTHRLTAVENADLILVMEQGQIVQQGTHARLSKVPGWYRDIYEYQKLEQMVDAGR